MAKFGQIRPGTLGEERHLGNRSSIIPDHDLVCTLLQKAISLLQQPGVISVIGSHALELTRSQANTRPVKLPSTAEVCRMAIMMAFIEEADHHDWPERIVGQANRFVQMHARSDESGDTMFEKAQSRLSAARDDCRSMKDSGSA